MNTTRHEKSFKKGTQARQRAVSRTNPKQGKADRFCVFMFHGSNFWIVQYPINFTIPFPIFAKTFR